MRFRKSGHQLLNIVFLAIAYILLVSPETHAFRFREIVSDGTLRRKASDIIIAKSSKNFRIGEKVTYKITWMGLSAGFITSEISGLEKFDGMDVYKIILKVKTNDFVSLIYKIEDTYTSLLEKDTLLSLRHTVHRREGNYKKDAVTRFDHRQRKAFFKNTLDGSQKTFDIPQGALDPLSAYYAFRAMNIEKNALLELRVINDEKYFSISGIVERKGFMQSIFGLTEAILIKPKAILKGEEIKDGRVRGYISTDERRIPLHIVIRGPLFTEVSATLIGFE